MNAKMLKSEHHLNAETGCRCRYVHSNTEFFRPHYHDYFEIFLMVKGKSRHIVNDTEQILVENSLLFVRDFDKHDYIMIDDNQFDFINLAFSREILNEVFGFLGDAFPAEALMSRKTPPSCVLSSSNGQEIFYKMSELIDDDNSQLIRLKLKMLLAKIFTSYFMGNYQRDKDIPLWLYITYEKMKKPQNFIVGIERMYELSGKTPEHLSRTLKKYYNTTPSKFVNQLRLNHCASLLVSSNLSVTDICFASGFENLSWFYKQFYNYFGVSPLQYRKLHI